MLTIAQAQRGRVSREQLRLAGLTPAMIRSRLSAGWLRPVYPGVYIVGPADDVEFGREVAALLLCHLDAVLSHSSSAALWALPVPAGPTVHVMVTSKRQPRVRPELQVHRSRCLPPADVTTKHGLPLTTPARTLLDLADLLSPRQLERALDEALAQRITSRTKLYELLARSGPGRRGAPILLKLLAAQNPPAITRSEAEERLLALIVAAHLPRPEVNVRVHGYELDFFWRDAGVVAEVDGIQWHSTPGAVRRDRRKDAVLARHGLVVIRITWEQITGEPLAVVARLTRAIIERSLLRPPRAS